MAKFWRFLACSWHWRSHPYYPLSLRFLIRQLALAEGTSLSSDAPRLRLQAAGLDPLLHSPKWPMEMWWSNLQGDFNLRLETTSSRKGGLFAVSLNQSTCTPKGKGEAFKKQRRIIPLARNQTLFLFLFLPACLLKLTSLNLLQNPDENLFRSFHQLNAFDQLLLVALEIYSKAMFFTDWSLFDALRQDHLTDLENYDFFLVNLTCLSEGSDQEEDWLSSKSFELQSEDPIRLLQMLAMRWPTPHMRRIAPFF